MLKLPLELIHSIHQDIVEIVRKLLKEKRKKKEKDENEKKKLSEEKRGVKTVKQLLSAI